MKKNFILIILALVTFNFAKAQNFTQGNLVV